MGASIGACVGRACPCCLSEKGFAHGGGEGGSEGPSPFAARMDQLWDAADTNANGVLDFKELMGLVRQLNSNMPKAEVKRRFKKFDIDSNGVLTRDEFASFFRTVQSVPQAALDLFAKHARPNKYMTTAAFRRFLREEQGEALSIGKVASLMERLVERAVSGGSVSTPEARDLAKGMSVEVFAHFITSAEYNNVWHPRSTKVTHDMRAPLSHYFISSSHNTYLAGNQLTGDSSVRPIIRALKLGVRVVELDCYDGKTEPTITHGGTLTSQLKFRDAVQAVRDHAFSASAFPVVITLENHCSYKFQGMQARILDEVLGDMLFHPPGTPSTFASPVALQHMVLIRCKPKGHTVSPSKPSKAKGPAPSAHDSSDEDTPKPKMHPALLKLIYLRNTKYKLAFKETDGDIATSSSLNYVKLQKVSAAKPGPQAMLKHAQRHLLRVYPTAAHMDSSNWDPLLAWNRGCQLAALNYQTNGMPVWMNQAMFRDNGGCGYVKKPDFMLTRGKLAFDAAKCKTPVDQLTISILSGHYLPKPNGETVGEVIDPYVEVSVAGVPADNQARTTKVVQDNGFNPEWGETFKFNLCCPELAFLRLVVRDDDGVGSELIGQAVVRIGCLRTGFRLVPLRRPNSAPLGDAYLFVHIRRAGSGRDTGGDVSMTVNPVAAASSRSSRGTGTSEIGAAASRGRGGRRAQATRTHAARAGHHRQAAPAPGGHQRSAGRSSREHTRTGISTRSGAGRSFAGAGAGAGAGSTSRSTSESGFNVDSDTGSARTQRRGGRPRMHQTRPAERAAAAMHRR